MPPISHVKITNYKSIADLDFEARRVNIFIGGPNAGKSNILEAFAFLSPGAGIRFRENFRIKESAELFRDNQIDESIGLQLNGGHLGWTLQFLRSNGQFQFSLKVPGIPHELKVQFSGALNNWPVGGESPFRYYIYRRELFADGKHLGYDGLDAPFGQNLQALLFSNKTLRDSVSALFKAHAHRLEIRPSSHELLISKEIDDILYSYPFSAISETLRRIVFYKAVLETNTERVLILDEPEANTFPFYTKWLAERIALDETNQFFLTTHNPYVLMSIIEKTPAADLAVYATRMHNYRTEIRLLSNDELAEALDLGMDLFLNLERYFPE